MHLLFGFLWNMTLVPGGAKAVLFKSKFPSIVVCAEVFGFHIEGLIMFNVIYD